MSFLSHFFRSDQKLSKPNFANSRIEHFDLSGNLVEIKDPKQTATIPFSPSKNKINIYRKDKEFFQKWGNIVTLCYNRGWDFWGKDSHPKGGIICDMRISFFPEELEQNFNQFTIKCQKKSFLVHWFVIWGKQAGAKELGKRGKDTDFQYPANEKDIDIIDQGETFWLKSSASFMNGPPQIKYSIPLSARHNLIITFETHAYRDVDFHSPATNLKETAMAVIDDFMDSIKITYSEQSLKDMQAAKSASQ